MIIAQITVRFLFFPFMIRLFQIVEKFSADDGNDRNHPELAGTAPEEQFSAYLAVGFLLTFFPRTSAEFF
jgi:hypothetical protein